MAATRRRPRVSSLNRRQTCVKCTHTFLVATDDPRTVCALCVDSSTWTCDYPTGPGPRGTGRCGRPAVSESDGRPVRRYCDGHC